MRDTGSVRRCTWPPSRRWPSRWTRAPTSIRSAAVCYEMLAGRPTHAGPTVHAVIAQRVTATPPDIRTFRPETPLAVELALARRALARRRRPVPLDHRVRPGPDRPGRVAPAGRRVPRWAWIALATVSTAAAVHAGTAPVPTRSAASAGPAPPAPRIRRRGSGSRSSGSRTWATAGRLLRRRYGRRDPEQARGAARPRGDRPRELQPIPGERQAAGEDRAGARRALPAHRHGAVGEGGQAEPGAGEPRADRGQHRRDPLGSSRSTPRSPTCSRCRPASRARWRARCTWRLPDSARAS